MALDVTTLCERHKTDKCKGDFPHSTMYDKLFPPFRDRPITLLEIGVNRTRSIKVWEDYFPQASIYGIDRKKRAVYKRVRRATIGIVDQSDTERLIEFAEEHGPFDIIIDDGSHMTSHQISSFEALWPYVKPEGLYIVEDTETSYVGKYIDSDQTCVEYFQSLVDDLNKATGRRPAPYREIETIMFRQYAIVVTKR